MKNVKAWVVMAIAAVMFSMVSANVLADDRCEKNGLVKIIKKVPVVTVRVAKRTPGFVFRTVGDVACTTGDLCDRTIQNGLDLGRR